MQHVRFLIIPCLLALVALLVVFTVQPAAMHAQSGATVTILADRLNVRSGPATTYAVIGSAGSGEKYSVIGQNGGCAWLQIAKSSKAWGWVSGSKSYVTLSSACSAIPAAGTAAPAAGTARQGCALLLNQLKFDVALSVKRSDGRQSSWSIPVGGQVKACVDPGSYTATFTAAGQTGSMAFPLVVKGGEYYEIPLSLPGN